MIEAWISGEATVPDRKLLMLADALVTWATETKQK